ncbi:MAG: hypothetical protein ACODAU_11320 [Myxococcota bacterium]
MRLLALVTVLSALLSACAEEASRGPSATTEQEPKEERSAKASSGPYGPDGELRESERAIAGLTLPEGLEPLYERDRQHAYRTKVPTAAVMRYFGPRLLTGEVDRVGSGAVYRNAVPKDARGGVVKLDVSVLPAASGTRVIIAELRPAPEQPPSLDAIKRRLRAQSDL